MRRRKDYDYELDYEEDEYDDEYDDEYYRRRPSRVWRLARVLLIVLLALVIVTALFYVKAPAVSDSPALGARQDGIYTLLVVGLDAASSSTDTIMICSLDTNSGSLDVVNIPRDTLVNVSWSTKKVNSLYAFTGGTEGMISGISDFLGFTPDNYVIVNMDAFVALLEIIGGVDFEVPLDMDYDDPAQDLSIHVSAGYQHLDATQAMGVFRWRQNNDGSGYANGDIGRIATQQAFLSAVASQCLKITNVFKAGAFLKLFDDYVETDLENGNLIWYGLKLLLMDSDNITFHVLPGNYGAYMGGLSYVAMYPYEWMDIVNEYLNPYQWDVTEANVSILTLDSNGNPYVVGG